MNVLKTPQQKCVFCSSDRENCYETKHGRKIIKCFDLFVNGINLGLTTRPGPLLINTSLPIFPKAFRHNESSCDSSSERAVKKKVNPVTSRTICSTESHSGLLFLRFAIHRKFASGGAKFVTSSANVGNGPANYGRG